MLTCMYQAICTCRQTLIKGVLNQGQSPQRTPLLYAHMNQAICTCRQTLIKGVLNQGQSPQRTPLTIWPPVTEENKNINYCTCTHTSSYIYVQTNANQGCTEPGAEPPTYTLAICSHTCMYQAICTCRQTVIKGVLNQG